ncbi:MAG: hypothetical protein ACJAQZ_002000 [Planctomycetota bacterium]|jgi:hypothetical protein
MSAPRTPTRNAIFAVLSLALLPLVWLAPCVFGDRTFVSYDINQFPPSSITATDSELALAREGANFDVTEVPVWFVPELELASRELQAGRLPTWNPTARGGAPLHAHGLIGLCYPPNWLALFADEPASKLGLVAWCNLALAGLLAFGLFRQLGFGLPAAWFGAALFQLSGPVAANSFFWMRLASFIWLPGVLWPMLRIAQAERFKPLATLALAVAFAMTWLAGFPPFAATTTIFAGGLFVWLTAESLVTHGRQHAMRLAGCLLAGLILGACWALPQVLPSLAFFPESARLPKPLWTDISGQAFEPYGLLGYLMPNGFGDPTTLRMLPYMNSPMQLLLNARLLENGNAALPNYNFTEYSIFVSSFGIVLAIIGAIFARSRRAGFARIALLLALGLGLFWPGLQLLFHLPIVQNVWPFRWPAAGTLFVTWLAACGFERVATSVKRTPLVAGIVSVIIAGLLWWLSALPLQYHADNPEWAIESLVEHFHTDRTGVVNHVQGDPPVDFDRFEKGFEQFAQNGAEYAAWLFAIGILMMAFTLLKHARARQGILVTAALASIVQLALHGAPLTHGANNAKGKDSEVHAFLREQAEARKSGGGFQIVRTDLSPGQPKQLPPGQIMHPAVHDLNFYSHADARTLVPVRMLLERKLSKADGDRIAGKGFLTQSIPATLLRHPLFDLMAVRYALTTDPVVARTARITGAVVGPELRSKRGALFVIERPNALNRIYVAQSLTHLPDDAAVLEAITAETLQPRQQAFVTEADLPKADHNTARLDEIRAVNVTRNHPNHIEIEVVAGKTKHLVVADTFLPGWHATINGNETTIIRCNHSQRMIVLPETACQVVFTYEAPGLKLGFWMMLIATVIAFAAWLLLIRRKRPARAMTQTQE